MFNQLRLNYHLKQAIKLGTEMSMFGPTTDRLNRLYKLENKIIDLQNKTETVAEWNAQLKIWFNRIAIEPSWRQTPIKRSKLERFINV